MLWQKCNPYPKNGTSKIDKNISVWAPGEKYQWEKGEKEL